MYVEIIIVVVVILYILVYNKIVDTKKFLNDNKSVFLRIKEKDYDFLLRAKYGEKVYDPNEVYMKRVRNGLLAIFIGIFIFISSLNALKILICIVAGFVIFKVPYFELRSYYKKHLNVIDGLLPYYLKSLEVLVHHYTVPVALAKSIDDAPSVFKPGLKELVAKIEAGDATVDPYMDFANEYPVRDSMRMMRLLYRLGLGEQDKKHEQMVSFSKSVSALQLKAREMKYKERLDKMEKQTMTMLVCTGGSALLVLLIAAFNMLSTT